MGYGYRAPEGHDCVMLEPYDGLSCEGEESRPDYEDAWADMLETIRCSLPASLSWSEGVKWIGNALIIASGKLHCLTIEEDEGGYGYAYLTVRPRPDFPDILRFDDEERQIAFAELSVPLVARCLFNRIAATYPLRVPNGYTSYAWAA